MEGKTHIAGGIAAGSFYLMAGEPVGTDLLFIGSCMLGSLIPDIDHTGSMIGRRVPLLDNIINAVFGHRTITHSLLFMLLFMLLFRFTEWPVSVELGLLIGIGSHLFLDALTTAGIRILWPLKFNFAFPTGIKTGGMAEQIFLIGLVVFIGYCGYELYF